MLSALQYTSLRIQCFIRHSKRQSLLQQVAKSTRHYSASQGGPGVTKSTAPSSHIDLRHVRNIGIIAHIDAGKTTTTERMLYFSGMTHRIGDVDEGSTIMDFLPAERARGITIQSAAITFNWPPLDSKSSSYPSHAINLIDTPGHADFTFEVERSIRVLDGAVTILDGVAGVEAQTEKVWRQADRYAIPRIIFVNKLDREGAEFGRVVKEIAARLGVTPAVLQIPLLEIEKDVNAARVGEEIFAGVVDVVEMKVVRWEHGSDGRNMEVFPLLDLKNTKSKVYEEAIKARAALVEVLAAVDEVLVEKFLEVEDAQLIQPEDIKRSLRYCTLNSSTQVIPVLAGAAFRNMGVQPLLDAVLEYLPSPMEAGKDQVAVSVQGEKAVIKAQEKGNVCALAFKVVQDAKRGVLVYVRVYSGTLTRGTNLFNTNLQTKEKALRLLRMYANEPHDIEMIPTGHIGVIVGLKHARTGDTLINASNLLSGVSPTAHITKHHKREKKYHKKHDKVVEEDHDYLTDATLQLRPINVPPPVFFASLEPSSLSEQRNLEEALGVLLREDPSLHTSVDEDSGQTLLSGMGELHLEISKDRLVNDLKAKADMGSIRIGYREVVARRVDGLHKSYEREIAGKRNSAGVTVSIEAIREDDLEANEEDSPNMVSRSTMDGNEIIVELETPDGTDPSDVKLPGLVSIDALADALTTGAITALSRGPTLNFPVHSTKVTIIVNTETDFESGAETSLSSFTSATRLAVITGFKDAGSVLMEPVMNVVITVDDSDLGAVVGDISSGGGGGTVISLDDDDGDFATSSTSSSSFNTSSGHSDAPIAERATIDVSKVYAPPDSYLANAISSDHGSKRAEASMSKPRNVRARVPLKKMVGYMNHLRSLTKGRGTFVMSVDRFERMSDARTRTVMMEMRGV